MTSARAYRSALLSLCLCVASTSCRITSEPTPGANAPATDTIVSTTPPFQTREPEHYSAKRTTTIFHPNGAEDVTIKWIARDGPARREEEMLSTRVVYLELPEGRFVLMPDTKVYAAAIAADATATSSEAEENSPDRLLHTDPISTTYQVLGSESVNGRSASRYRIVVNNSASENVTQNETLMWIDDTLKMPIKSETKSSDGKRMVIELSDVALNPDKQLFQIPAGYEKIAFSALQKQLKQPPVNPSVR